MVGFYGVIKFFLFKIRIFEHFSVHFGGICAISLELYDWCPLIDFQIIQFKILSQIPISTPQHEVKLPLLPPIEGQTQHPTHLDTQTSMRTRTLYANKYSIVQTGPVWIWSTTFKTFVVFLILLEHFEYLWLVFKIFICLLFLMQWGYYLCLLKIYGFLLILNIK